MYKLSFDDRKRLEVSELFDRYGRAELGEPDNYGVPAEVFFDKVANITMHSREPGLCVPPEMIEKMFAEGE